MTHLFGWKAGLIQGRAGREVGQDSLGLSPWGHNAKLRRLDFLGAIDDFGVGSNKIMVRLQEKNLIIMGKMSWSIN